MDLSAAAARSARPLDRVDPIRPQTIYAGVEEGGIFRSRDKAAPAP